VQKAALHTLGKFVASGTHDQIQLVFEYVAVQIRPIFLSHLEEHILNEVCAFQPGTLGGNWCLDKIAIAHNCLIFFCFCILF
jgi:hypothetical protein